MPESDTQSVRDVLEQASAASKNETVVFRFKGHAGAAAPSPAETLKMAHALVERAAARHGQQPTKVNIFENLGSFLVQGNAAMLLDLLDQPEVAAATINRRTSVEPIRPVKKAAATLKGCVDVSE
jgi:hypothetical protein